MHTLNVQTVDGLATTLATFGNEVLYRGQNGHFGTESTSGLRTSFDRHGCSPPVMLKWTHYAERHKRVLFEIRELVWLPETMSGPTWGKGLWVQEVADGLIEVGDLVVDHPGQQVIGFGALAMWSYHADDSGRWTRTPRDGDCTCGDNWRHEAHLSALSILEHDFERRDGLFAKTLRAAERLPRD